VRLFAPLVALALALVATTVGVRPAAAAPSACRIPAHAPGWEAIFGYRTTQAAALSLRRKAEKVGFRHLAIDQVGCPRWAVALHGLQDRAQSRELAAEAKRAGYAVLVKCWPLRDVDPAWEAVFGSRLTRRAATRLEANARRAGFVSLKLLHEPCSDTWLVELDGIPTLKQAREFRAEATHAGFTVTLRRH
jgi:hypothetical protein